MRSLRIRHIDSRRGAILVLFGILLVVILGMVACALDVGWMVMTRTQLQAAADSAALAGGTELLSGLGFKPARLPGEVVTAAAPIAVEYAGKHRNGDVAASYADQGRDIQFGWAKFNPQSEGSNIGTWSFDTGGQTGTGWYNAVRATLHRDVSGSKSADYPLPLILAPVLGQEKANLSATATAIILPAHGIRIDKDSGQTPDLMPFGLRKDFWDKYRRAQKYYANDPGVLDLDLVELGKITDNLDPIQAKPLFVAADGSIVEGNLGSDYIPPLFGHTRWDGQQIIDWSATDRTGTLQYTTVRLNKNQAGVVEGQITINGVTQTVLQQFVQDFFDNWYAVEGMNSVSSEVKEVDSRLGVPRDGILELIAYPRGEDTIKGNFGTIDVGGADNSTSDLSRQILEGVNEQDLIDMGVDPETGLVIDGDEKQSLIVDPDVGLSASVKAALDSIVGEPRAVALFSGVGGQGDAGSYTLVELEGVRIMNVDFSTALELKNLVLQMTNVTLVGGIADWDGEITGDTTVFTPLILID